MLIVASVELRMVLAMFDGIDTEDLMELRRAVTVYTDWCREGLSGPHPHVYVDKMRVADLNTSRIDTELYARELMEDNF